MKVKLGTRLATEFLQAETDKRQGNGIKQTVVVYTWPNRAQLGVRVAEVDFTYGEPGQPGSGGASFMQVDVPHGIAVCALMERLIIAYGEEWPADELGEEQERLVYEIWGGQ